MQYDDGTELDGLAKHYEVIEAFKVGDKVTRVETGSGATVTAVDSDEITVCFHDNGKEGKYAASEFRKAERERQEKKGKKTKLQRLCGLHVVARTSRR